MPQIFKVGPYTIFFWSNESDPLEPLHVHVAERANQNATKIWITATGKCYLCHNKSRYRTGFSEILCVSLKPEAKKLKNAGLISLEKSLISANTKKPPQ